MKTEKIINCLFAALIVTFCSCSADAILFDEYRKEKQPVTPDEKPQITMTLTGNQLTVYLTGDGSVSIDWGDGTQTEKELENSSTGTECKKIYSNATNRTVVISGGNITGLRCDGNQITSLDVSEITVLTSLICSDNQLSELNVDKNTALKWFVCSDNQLSSLSLNSNTALFFIDCQNNLFVALQLNNLFNSLHENPVSSGKTVIISGNSGADSCDKSIAEKKGWTVE